MSSYISSNANRFYAALESAYGQVGTISAANRIPAVKLGITQQLETVKRQGQDGQPNLRRVAAGRPAAHGFRPEDVYDKLAERSAGTGVRAAVSGRSGSGSDDVRRRDGGIEHGRRQTGFPGAAWSRGGAGGGVRGRNPVRGGDRGCEHGAVERAIHGATGDGRRGGGGGDVRARNGSAEREPVRLLVAGDGGAAAAVRRGGRPDGHLDQRRFSRVPLPRPGARRVGQQQLLLRSGGQLAELSGGAGAGRVRLLDRAGAHGPGVAGRVALAVPDDHSGTISLKNNLDTRDEGVREQPAAGDIARPAVGDGRFRSLQPGRSSDAGPVPGGPAAIAYQRHVSARRAARVN